MLLMKESVLSLKEKTRKEQYMYNIRIRTFKLPSNTKIIL